MGYPDRYRRVAFTGGGERRRSRRGVGLKRPFVRQFRVFVEAGTGNIHDDKVFVDVFRVWCRARQHAYWWHGITYPAQGSSGLVPGDIGRFNGQSMRPFFLGVHFHLSLAAGQHVDAGAIVVAALEGGGGHVLVGKRDGQRVAGGSPQLVVVVVGGGPDR